MSVCKTCGKKYSKWISLVNTRGVCGDCFEAELSQERKAEPQIDVAPALVTAVPRSEGNPASLGKKARPQPVVPLNVFLETLGVALAVFGYRIVLDLLGPASKSTVTTHGLVASAAGPRLDLARRLFVESQRRFPVATSRIKESVAYGVWMGCRASRDNRVGENYRDINWVENASGYRSSRLGRGLSESQYVACVPGARTPVCNVRRTHLSRVYAVAADADPPRALDAGCADL